MLPPLATSEELSARLGHGFDGDEVLRADAILDDASTLVRSEAGFTWVDEEEALEDVPDVAVTVTLAAAQRAFRNPDGLLGETLGSYSYRAADGTLPGVYLTEAEIRMLRRLAGGSVQTVRTARPGLDRAGHGTVYLDVVGSDEPIPWDVVEE